MSMIWFATRDGAGFPASVDVTEDFERACGGGEDPVTLFVERPGAVRYPEELITSQGLASREARITDETTLECCPKCGARGPLKAWITEHDIVIVPCAACRQYVWCS